MTDVSIIDQRRAWCHSLRLLIGYPDWKPVAHTLAFAGGPPENFAKAAHIASLAEELQRDFVYIGFSDGKTVRPRDVSLAVRQAAWVTWHGSVSLYAEDGTAPLSFLAQDRRFFLGERNQLMSGRLPSLAKRATGHRLAMRRWREAAASIMLPGLGVSALVPSVQPMPMAIPLRGAFTA